MFNQWLDRTFGKSMVPGLMVYPEGAAREVLGKSRNKGKDVRLLWWCQGAGAAARAQVCINGEMSCHWPTFPVQATAAHW